MPKNFNDLQQGGNPITPNLIVKKRDLLKELTIFDEEFSYQVAEPSLAMLAVGLIAMLTKHS